MSSVLVVEHLTKDVVGDALDRLLGSSVRVDQAGTIYEVDADRIDMILPTRIRLDRSVPIIDGKLRLIEY